ncbi:DNA-methyltransferase [Neisseria elongata]|jgi:DNA modification methylase|uniref:DNA-methyltransferase n=1 Tax=Neisseria elongata TaxID=495 RepID=UPI000D3C0A0D|nr:site-specific DNA-methyltransferase [Neisseria elongata]DAY13400.1 MAG TPA: adenine-specific methyltransferase [Caudoviricetes sp.]
MNLQHGDCLDLLPKLADNSIDLIVTDPPYGMTVNSWDKKPDLPRLWSELHRVGKENAAFVMFAAQPFATDLIQSNRKHFRYDLVWQKTMAVGFLNANRMPLRSHELMLVFYRHPPVYFPQKTVGKPYRSQIKARRPGNYGGFNASMIINHGDRHPLSVWKYGIDADKYHPTQKPVALLERLIKSYSREGDTVLDCFMGSGSTGIACLNTNRRFIGMELDGKYFQAASKRIAEHRMQAEMEFGA